jgi:hypothetical protein
MRTSGGRGNEGWIVAIPIVGLIVAAMMSSGGVDGMLIVLEGVVRTAMTSVGDLVRALF